MISGVTPGTAAIVVGALRSAMTKSVTEVSGRPAAGDFNQHDQLWGGDEVALSRRQGEAQGLVDLMIELDLQSLLPRGTKTFEGECGDSTIDLVLATPALAEAALSCQPYHTEHGSDHVAIDTSFFVPP